MLTAVLAGCGAMSARWIDAIKTIDGLRLVGLVDVDVERARACAERHGLGDATIDSDLGAMLSARRPDILFDVVPPEARREVVLAGLAGGCHVLSEKPMAMRMEDARAMVAAARRHGRLHAVMQNRRYLGDVRRLRRLLASGILGRITSLHADFFIGPHFGGFRENMEHVLLLDMAIHTFDVARYLVGAAPKSVCCFEWEPANSWYRSGSSVAAGFEFADRSIFTYRGSWCAVGLKTSWEANWRIACERGGAIWDGVNAPVAERASGSRDGLFDAVEPVEVPPLDPSDRVGGHLGVIEDFIRAIRNGSEPETRGADNINSLAMALAAAESVGAERRVAISI
ncbi:MAG: Gfo/Idh/MocA family oxidoreductase [Bradyrhizobium sp.]|nr:MAG: Gfo/Idh/MocA family oxidoreductase [Bradyrhizobium sp.]